MLMINDDRDEYDAIGSLKRFRKWWEPEKTSIGRSPCSFAPKGMNLSRLQRVIHVTNARVGKRVRCFFIRVVTRVTSRPFFGMGSFFIHSAANFQHL